MNTEEYQVIQILRDKSWEKYKPGIPFDFQSVDWVDFAIELTNKTGNEISGKTLMRFFDLKVSDDIKQKKKSKGVISMYALGEKSKRKLSNLELHRFYSKFLQFIADRHKVEEGGNEVDEKKTSVFIENISGVYESYITSNRLKSIRKSILELSNDGSVKCKSTPHIEYLGKVESKFFGRLIVINLKLAGTEFGFQTILHNYNDPYEIILKGVYSGIDMTNQPMAGRELLIKTDKEYASLIPELYRVKSQEFIDLITERPIIKDFFLGKLDTYNDTLSIMKEIENIEPNTN